MDEVLGTRMPPKQQLVGPFHHLPLEIFTRLVLGTPRVAYSARRKFLVSTPAIACIFYFRVSGFLQELALVAIRDHVTSL